MKVLAIETSCDETAVAIVTKKDDTFHVEKNIVASQIETHKKFGGVVPEVAARMHVPVIPHLIEEATNWQKEDIDAIAVTAGPGLATALRVGIETAKALASQWSLPLIPVNHIEGHIYANFLTNEKIEYPALCLIVSGGHTELVMMNEPGQYEKIGQTRDDAAGEAFDKTAAQLALPYPGGPSIEKMAKLGDPKKFDLPRPMMNSKDYDMSFSGLKTAVKNQIKNYTGPKDQQFISDMSASFVAAVVDVLVGKTVAAAEDYAPNTILLCGGVSASQPLRQALQEAFEDTNTKIILPEMQYTTDNASMIGAAGLALLENNKAAKNLYELDADPSIDLGEKWKWE